MSLLSKSLLGLAALAIPAVGGLFYLHETDRGFRRSVAFWSQAFPIYLRYRFTLWRVEGDPENVRDAAFEELHERYAGRAMEIILQLKAFYVKLGQMGASRADMMPKQYVSRLSKLQDECPCEDFAVIRSVVESALGQPLEAVFLSFDPKPLGSASIGQVHKAVLRDGRTVAVKVMYPDVETLFRSDIKTCRAFCSLAQPAYLPMMDEIERQFATEFDYAREAENLAEIRRNLLASPFSKLVQVPAPVPELCRRDVLVMEFMPGVKMADALTRSLREMAAARGMPVAALLEDMSAHRDKYRLPSSTTLMLYSGYIAVADLARNTLAAAYNVTLGWAIGYADYRTTTVPLDLAGIMDLLVAVHGHEVLVDGAFNGDPHPGNLLLLPDGKLGLIDYGQVKRISSADRVQLAKLIVALSNRDREAVVEQMIAMGFRTKRMDREVLYTHGVFGFDRDDKSVLGDKNLQMFLEDLDRRDPVIVMPGEFIMASRLSILLRGMGTLFNYPLAMADAWRPIADHVLEMDRLRQQSSGGPR